MDCIDLFKRAAMALQTDPRYVILDQARKANDKDEELQNLIGEFNLARMDLNNEIGKNERDDARIAELNEKVNSLYGQIMGNEGMVAYNEAKRECENLVNYIDAIINTAMNGGDPMTVQEPSASCTGSRSTCGGRPSAKFFCPAGKVAGAAPPPAAAATKQSFHRNAAVQHRPRFVCTGGYSPQTG